MMPMEENVAPDKSRETLPLLQTRPDESSPLPRCLRGLSGCLPPVSAQGMVLVAMSAFMFSVMSAVIKFVSSSMSSMEISFWRAFVSFVLNLIVLRVNRQSLSVPRDHWWALAARCLFGFSSMSLMFYAIQQMVLADASVLVFTSPVMTFFVGALVLHEHVDRINLGLAIFSFVGVICVSRPTFLFGDNVEGTEATASPPFAIVCALLSATFQAFAYVSVRSLRDLHFMVVIHYFMLTTSVLSMLWLIVVERAFVVDLPASTLLAVMSTGVIGFAGQLCLTRGFQLESAGPASIMRYLDVVFVFIWDSALLHEHISMWSIIGACIICSCAIVIALRRMHSQR